MSLKIALDVDHTRFYVETHEGHHISVPCNEQGARQMQRLLLAQKAQELQDSLVARPDKISLGQLDYWRTHGVGSNLAPTQQEIDHNLSHDPRFPKDTCPFCRVLIAANKAARVEALSEDDLLEMFT
jgi:hypothetical protein